MLHSFSQQLQIIYISAKISCRYTALYNETACFVPHNRFYFILRLRTANSRKKWMLYHQSHVEVRHCCVAQYATEQKRERDLEPSSFVTEWTCLKSLLCVKLGCVGVLSVHVVCLSGPGVIYIEECQIWESRVFLSIHWSGTLDIQGALLTKAWEP